MRPIATLGEFLAEAARMPSAFPNLVREAKRQNDELAALLEQVREKTKSVDALDSAVEQKLRAMGQTTAKVGRILVTLEERPGRASYSYKEAESLYYSALMKLNKAAAEATARLVEGLKKMNPGRTEVKFSVSESAVGWVREWLSRVWSGIVSVFGEYERMGDKLAAINSDFGPFEAAGSNDVCDDIITAAIAVGLKPNLFVHTVRADGVHVEFGSNVRMEAIADLADELRRMGRDVRAKRSPAGNLVVNESVGWMRSSHLRNELGVGGPRDTGGYDRDREEEMQALCRRRRQAQEDRMERLGLKPGMPVTVEVPGEATEDPRYVLRLRDALRRNPGKPGHIGSIDQGAGEALVHFPGGQTVRVLLADLRVVEGEGSAPSGYLSGKPVTTSDYLWTAAHQLVCDMSDSGSEVRLGTGAMDMDRDPVGKGREWLRKNGFTHTLGQRVRGFMGKGEVWKKGGALIRLEKFAMSDATKPPEMFEAESVDFGQRSTADLAGAKESAKRMSEDCGCVVHVNKVASGRYRLEAWFDSDCTVASYENGKPLNESAEFKLGWKRAGDGYAVVVSDTRFEWSPSACSLTMTDAHDGTSLSWRGRVRSLDAATSVVANTLDGGDDAGSWGAPAGT